VSACASGLERSGALCYPPCKTNFTGVGPVCWEDCPAGYTDTGAFCQPNEQWGDTSACPADDKCGLIYKSSKGCVKCPKGMDANGCICSTPGNLFAKESYGRGAGVVMICAEGLQEQAGLCYTPCGDPTADPVGPICWAACPSNETYTCGGAVCVENAQECASNIKSLANALYQLVRQLAECAFDVEHAPEHEARLKKRAQFQELRGGREWSQKEKTAFRILHQGCNHGPPPRSGQCNPEEIAQEIKEVIQQLNLPICSDL